VVDGSPTWQVLRSMPLELQGPPSPALSAAVAPSQGLYTGGLQQPGTRGEAPGQLGLPSSSSSSSGGGSSSSLFIPDLSQGFDLDKVCGSSANALFYTLWLWLSCRAGGHMTQQHRQQLQMCATIPRCIGRMLA
jgi:hypothetical protein